VGSPSISLIGLGTPQHRYSLLLAVLWPVVVLVIAILALRHVTSAKDVADLISATASLLWPIMAFTVISWFRPELRGLLARIRKGKFLGQEIELDELQAKTEEAEATEAVAVTISGAGSATGAGSVVAEGGRVEGTGKPGFIAAEAEIEEVLREASRSPRIGLMLLSAKMERAARELASEFGVGTSRPNMSLSMLIRSLVEAEQLSREDASALSLFNHVRNRIVHGHDAGDDEIARAIDSGTRLLRLLLSRSRPPHGWRDASDGG
jgi:hypothetical protein